MDVRVRWNDPRGTPTSASSFWRTDRDLCEGTARCGLQGGADEVSGAIESDSQVEVPADPALDGYGHVSGARGIRYTVTPAPRWQDATRATVAVTFDVLRASAVQDGATGAADLARSVLHVMTWACAEASGDGEGLKSVELADSRSGAVDSGPRTVVFDLASVQGDPLSALSVEVLLISEAKVAPTNQYATVTADSVVPGPSAARSASTSAAVRIISVEVEFAA